MLQVSIFIEMLRSQPRVTFWLATLAQVAVWWLVPSIFYAAPPGDLPHVLAMGHEFQLGTWQGPPLAYWLAELMFRLAGLPGVYFLAQLCVIVTYWAVFTLARAIVGIHHAVIAVLLMLGISTMTLPTPDFGPSILAMPLAALIVLHFWRAIGQGQRSYWFLLAIEMGLLLLTTYAGLILLVLLMLFTGATARGRVVLGTVDPWIAGIVIVVMLFPHLIWLDVSTGSGFTPMLQRLRSLEAADTNLFAWLRMLSTVLIAHAGLGVMVVLAAGWWMRQREPVPNFVRGALDPFARQFVFFLAVAPAFAATVAAVVIGNRTPIGGIAPHVILSGLAVVVATGPVIAVHRQRIVGFAWGLLLVMPPAIAVAAIILLPWTAGVDLKVALPANEMGRYFNDAFERSTHRPLEIVTGDPQLAALVAVGAATRPSIYDYVRPARTPWVDEAEIRRRGALVVWTASDTAGAPPADIRARFPDLLPADLPRAFQPLIQGRLPLIRIGWGIIRPQNEPPAPGAR